MKSARILKTLLYIGTILILSASLTSCNKSKKGEEFANNINYENNIIEVKVKSHTWYYFTNNGFAKTDKPQNAPYASFKPWTEAYRISSANSALEADGDTAKGFAIVNRLGVLCFENDKVTLSKDAFIFDDRTADNLIFIDNTPVFSVYKSSFFNETTNNQEYQDDDTKHLFLVQYDGNTKVSYPLINCNNLVDRTNSEVTDFFWNGNNWVCSIKTIQDNRTYFNYINWTSTVPLLTLTPENATEGITIEEIDFDTFKDEHKVFSYNQAPERIRNLLINFSDKKSFGIDVKSAGGYSIRSYLNMVETEDPFLEAKGLLAQSWSAVLFQDGTFYLEGALSGKHILRNGKPIALRLPKLPPNFIYSDFVISSTTLYAAWEETQFFETSKSGFIAIDLEKLLY